MSPIYGQLSDKPLLAFVCSHGVRDMKHNRDEKLNAEPLFALRRGETYLYNGLPTFENVHAITHFVGIIDPAPMSASNRSLQTKGQIEQYPYCARNSGSHMFMRQAVLV